MLIMVAILQPVVRPLELGSSSCFHPVHTSFFKLSLHLLSTYIVYVSESIAANTSILVYMCMIDAGTYIYEHRTCVKRMQIDVCSIRVRRREETGRSMAKLQR